MASLAHRLGSFTISLATALAILAIVMPLFLNPVWVAFEQDRSQAVAWTGFTPADLRAATDSILSDLVFGPPDFDVQVGGQAVLDERERAHMRDVRTVFMGFFAVTTVLVVAGVVVVWRRRSRDRTASWRAVRDGALGLIVGLVLLGGYAFIAFDILFEVFHRLFFAGGSYNFDPATERLVQLFPFAFWQETAIIHGVASIVVAVGVSVVAQWRLGVARAAIGATDGPVTSSGVVTPATDVPS